jgi:hypothetical protein
MRLVRSLTSESKPAAITVPNHLRVLVDAAEVDGFGPAVRDHIGRGFGILGDPVFACMVVAGARRDDAEGNLAKR